MPGGQTLHTWEPVSEAYSPGWLQQGQEGGWGLSEARLLGCLCGWVCVWADAPVVAGQRASAVPPHRTPQARQLSTPPPSSPCLARRLALLVGGIAGVAVDAGGLPLVRLVGAGRALGALGAVAAIGLTEGARRAGRAGHANLVGVGASTAEVARGVGSVGPSTGGALLALLSTCGADVKAVDRVECW